MKKNRIFIISIVLAIAFVACPIESTRNITAGIGFILGGMARGAPAERRTAGIRGYCAAVHRHHDDEGGMDRGIGQ